MVKIKSKAFIAFIACLFISLSYITNTLNQQSTAAKAESNGSQTFQIQTAHGLTFLEIEQKVLVMTQINMIKGKSTIDCDDSIKAMSYFLSPF